MSSRCSMKTIGITGPTGCGKTTFLQEIAAHGGVIVDCDGYLVNSRQRMKHAHIGLCKLELFGS